MSRQLYAFRSLKLPAGPAPAPPRAAPLARHAHAAVRTRPAPAPARPAPRAHTLPSSAPAPPRTPAHAPLAPEPAFAAHLDAVFAPLRFPPELARRVLTHASHPLARHGHNATFAFLGRRAADAFLLLFLSSSRALRPAHDLGLALDAALTRHVVGEHVGSPWGLGRAMRWAPNTAAGDLARLRNAGLYKVQGEAVFAVLGAINFQFGAAVAHRVFHTRVLPRLLLRRPSEGLPAAFHDDARAACERMGGAHGPLLLGAADAALDALAGPWAGLAGLSLEPHAAAPQHGAADASSGGAVGSLPIAAADRAHDVAGAPEPAPAQEHYAEHQEEHYAAPQPQRMAAAA